TGRRPAEARGMPARGSIHKESARPPGFRGWGAARWSRHGPERLPDGRGRAAGTAAAGEARRVVAGREAGRELAAEHGADRLDIIRRQPEVRRRLARHAPAA